MELPDILPAMFSFTNLQSQKDMFETAFKTVIRQKTDHEELNGYLHTLGERHIMRGIHKMHMERGYEAFFKAIKVGCPDITQQELIELTGSVRSSV